MTPSLHLNDTTLKAKEEDDCALGSFHEQTQVCCSLLPASSTAKVTDEPLESEQGPFQIAK